MAGLRGLVLLACYLSGLASAAHYKLESRAENVDGSKPIYKNPNADIEARVNDLLPRMTLEEKVSQLIQGDLNGWMDFSDPYDATLKHNQTGLEWQAANRAGSFWGGWQTPWPKFVYAVNVGQKYLMENTTLGIPALIQSEALHGFLNNGTMWPSPVSIAASFNPELWKKAAATMADEAEGLGINHLFAPVLDLARELRWGRVEEGLGEDEFLTGEMARAYVEGVQAGKRKGAGPKATARVAATCKHFAAFGSPQGGLNLAQVSGGERELRTTYLRPFHRACMDALSIMTAYSSYDGVPAIANKHLLIDILRKEWGYKYWVTTDAGSVDLLITLHGTCTTRECAARTTLVNGWSGEMGGGTYTYHTLPAQVKAGLVKEKDINEAVKGLLRTKFALGLFENPYPYENYAETIRRPETKELLRQMEQEVVVLLENKDKTLPLSKNLGSIAIIGPQADRVVYGDYIFYGSEVNGTTALAGVKEVLGKAQSKIDVKYAEGCKLWSNDESGIPEAVAAAKSADAAVVFVGTWSLDQTRLWQPGTNATTGEARDQSDLGLVGAQMELIKQVKAVAKKTIVVFISGKPVAEPWVKDHADAVIYTGYTGELGGMAIAEVLFGDANPSGKLPVSFPRHVGTTPVFYNYLKGGRPRPDPGRIGDDGTMTFGHQYILDDPTPLWSFGHGLSYTTFKYSDLVVSPSRLQAGKDFSVQVTVQNTGSIAGKEVVQVYITDVESSVVTPNQQLVGFKKINLAPGASQKVKIDIPAEQLALWTYDNKWVVEPGLFQVKLGSSQQTIISTNLTVV